MTPDLRLPFQSQDIVCFDWYLIILLDDRNTVMGVNNLPKLTLDRAVTGIQTHDH